MVTAFSLVSTPSCLSTCRPGSSLQLDFCHLHHKSDCFQSSKDTNGFLSSLKQNANSLSWFTRSFISKCFSKHPSLSCTIFNETELLKVGKDEAPSSFSILHRGSHAPREWIRWRRYLFCPTCRSISKKQLYQFPLLQRTRCTVWEWKVLAASSHRVRFSWFVLIEWHLFSLFVNKNVHQQFNSKLT